MNISTVYPFEKDIPDIRGVGSTRPFSMYNSRESRLRPLYAIVAMGRDRSIGADGDMPWHLSEDLRHFKTLTMGHPVIMGRATWESLPKRPLPGRRNIVLSRQRDFHAEGAECASSLAEALQMCDNGEIPFIIGGGSIYREALPFLSRIYVTLIESEYPGADTFFPPLEEADWQQVSAEGPLESKNGMKYSFLELRRR